MQRVYLLLRNNQQTGPYSLEELLQFDLKPFDLIWIEGRSAGWYYPQEIQALQPHLSFLKQTSAQPVSNPVPTPTAKRIEHQQSKMVFVSMPSNDIKEEPTPKPSLASVTNVRTETPQSSAPVHPHKEPEVKTTYEKSQQNVETDYMNRVYQKKTKKRPVVSTKGAMVACLLVSIAFAGWMILKPSADSPVKTPPELPAFIPVQNELPADSAEEKSAPAQQTGNWPTNKKQKQNKTGITTNQATTVAKQETSKTQPEEIIVNTNTAENNEDEMLPEVEETKPMIEEKSVPTTAEAPKEKKKLRDKIADLFKKGSGEKGEKAKPVEVEDGERRSVRRETGSNLAQMVTVKFAIPNDWMMGIKGAKAALTNRSSEAIAKAFVEVVYYNDDNDVLDKKTISFSSIKSGQTQRVSIPDHQTATRLEYNIVSVTSANEPFAKK